MTDYVQCDQCAGRGIITAEQAGMIDAARRAVQEAAAAERAAVLRARRVARQEALAAQLATVRAWRTGEATS